MYRRVIAFANGHLDAGSKMRQRPVGNSYRRCESGDALHINALLSALVSLNREQDCRKLAGSASIMGK
jgi:hypothetical protein